MKAEEVLKNVPIVDAHSDLLMDVFYLRRQGQTRVIERKHLPGMRQGGVGVVVAALFVEGLFVPHQATEIALEMIDGLYQEMRESPGLFRLCTSYADIESALANHEIAFLLSLEGVEPLNGSLSLLRTFHRLGVRLMSLTWSRRNAAGEGSSIVGAPNTTAGGLSAFGKALVQEAVRLGILLDTSHLNDPGFADLVRVTDAPLFASHSNARALHNIERNASDEIIAEIARRGGVVGVNEVSLICAEKPQDATLQRLVEHMDHIRRIGGIQTVGLGLDFFEGIHLFDHVLPGDTADEAIYDIIKGYPGVVSLAQAMLDCGWKPEEVSAVMGGNFLRLFRLIQ